MLAPNKYNRATPGEVHDHATRAVEAALTYFNQRNPDFIVGLLAESPRDAAATCTVSMEYLRATIRYCPDQFCEHPETIWGHVGHEVAHLVSREMLQLRGALTKPETFEHEKFTEALEMLTTRLQRMFERDVPDPGWRAANAQ